MADDAALALKNEYTLQLLKLPKKVCGRALWLNAISAWARCPIRYPALPQNQLQSTPLIRPR